MSRRPMVSVPSGDGSSTYDEPRTGYVWIAASNRWARPEAPIFHCEADNENTEDLDPLGRRRRGWELRTECGRVIRKTSWLVDADWRQNDYQTSETGLEIPIRWALQFARPCLRCWP